MGNGKMAIAAVAAIAWAVPAGAQTVAEARSLAATCANCHGTGGVSQGGMPSLAGQPKDDIVRKMAGYRDGSRPGTVMPQLAKGYTPQQIETIAAWYAARNSR